MLVGLIYRCLEEQAIDTYKNNQKNCKGNQKISVI
jgi:hypothetical protein